MNILEEDIISNDEFNKIIKFINGNFKNDVNVSEKIKYIKSLSIFLKSNNIELNEISASIILDSSVLLYSTFQSLKKLFNSLKEESNISKLIDVYNFKNNSIDDLNEVFYFDNETSYINGTQLYGNYISNIKVLSKEEEIDLSNKIKNGDENAYNELVLHNLRLVYKYALKHKRGKSLNDNVDDLVQDGNIGLMEAAKRFDGKKGFKFSTYASWWINLRIEQGIEERNNLLSIPAYFQEKIKKYKKERTIYLLNYGKEPTKEEMKNICHFTVDEINEIETVYIHASVSLSSSIGNEDSTLEDIIPDGDSFEDKLQHSIYIHELFSKLNEMNLTEKEKTILFMRYGVGYDRTYTLDEIGKMYGVTRERIRQIEKKTLKRLKNEYKEIYKTNVYL